MNQAELKYAFKNYGEEVLPFELYEHLKVSMVESEVTDWDGEEPLRRNHRVKFDGYTCICIDPDIDGRVICKNESNGKLLLPPVGVVTPVKTKMERLYNEWNNLPKQVPPAVDPDGKYVRERYIEFAQFVLNREKSDT